MKAHLILSFSPDILEEFWAIGVVHARNPILCWNGSAVMIDNGIAHRCQIVHRVQKICVLWVSEGHLETQLVKVYIMWPIVEICLHMYLHDFSPRTGLHNNWRVVRGLEHRQRSSLLDLLLIIACFTSDPCCIWRQVTIDRLHENALSRKWEQICATISVWGATSA